MCRSDGGAFMELCLRRLLRIRVGGRVELCRFVSLCEAQAEGLPEGHRETGPRFRRALGL